MHHELKGLSVVEIQQAELLRQLLDVLYYVTCSGALWPYCMLIALFISFCFVVLLLTSMQMVSDDEWALKSSIFFIHKSLKLNTKKQ